MSLKRPLDRPEKHLDILTSGCNQFPIEGDCSTERIAGVLGYLTYLIVTERRQAAGRQTTTRRFGLKTQLVSIDLMVK
jgi:hypothetical protein